MSVDFYSCDCCGESRYEEYVGWCTSCGHKICTRCVVNDNVESDFACEYGIRFNGTDAMKEEFGLSDDFEIDEVIDDTSITPMYCPFCSGNQVTEGDLLDFMLNKFNISLEDITKEYLSYKNK